MIITRTPFRVSFFGGGSDMAAFYARATGAVLSTSIDKYMYISAHPYFHGEKIHLKYSSTELTDDVAALRHPIVRRVLQRKGIAGGIEITSTADVPAGTGLGSSSSFTVGMLHTASAYLGRQVPVERLAREACEIEIDDLGAPIGKQDQYAAAYGGLNFIRFFADGTVEVDPIVIPPACRAALGASLMMFYTGEQRSASTVLAEQRQAILLSDEKFAVMARMVEMAYEAKALLENSDMPAFGRLLDAAWRLKRSLTSGVTNAGVDALYDRVMDAGAWGGKLVGAGGGGFLLVVAPPHARESVRAALADRQELPIALERGGSKVVYMSDDT